MSYITTFTGKHFDPVHPEMDKMDIRDIAHALSMTCRGNGHVKHFFSVGQHCLNCCREAMQRGYEPRVIAACLLHDACEAYMSDVPRPFKRSMKEYIAAEENMLHLVYQKFLGSPLTEEEKKQVDQVDDAMLYYDLRDLLNEPVDPANPPTLHIQLSYEFVPFAQTEQEYLALFEQVNAMLQLPVV